MEPTLTSDQKKLARWLREQHEAGYIPESFTIRWSHKNYVPVDGAIVELEDINIDKPVLSYGAFSALENECLIKTIHVDKERGKKSGTKKIGGIEVFQYGWPTYERSRTYTLLGRLFELDDPSYAHSDLMKSDTQVPRGVSRFISEDLIDQLKSNSCTDFDVTRLIQYCEEINDNFKQGNYSSVAFLSRAILDHCPPIFGQPNFESVIAQSLGRSAKSIAERLDSSLKKISDHHIHKQTGRKEVLPVAEEVGFSNELNFLLGRIIEELER